MSPHPITEARGAMKVEELAAKSGVPAMTIVRIEAGLTEMPMQRTVVRLADALGLAPADLKLRIATHNARVAA